MLTDLVKGRKAADVAALPRRRSSGGRDPAHAGADEVRDPRPRGRQGRAQPLEGDAAARRVAGPRHWLSVEAWRRARGRTLADLPATMKLVEHEPYRVGVYNCGGELLAIEDRCSHDDGPLCLGNWDADDCTVVCPRHGASFDLESGRALSLPAYLPVRTFPVRVEDGIVVGRARRLSGDPVRCWPTTDAALLALPRRGVGPARPRRARHLRAALPRGLPVRPLVADDPAQARGLPRGVRRLRPRARRRASATPTSSGCSADAGIVRHRGKIEAAIANARATVALRERRRAAARALLGPRAAAPSGAAPRPPTGRRRRRSRPRSRSACARRASASSARRRSMPRMQACGVVNDHLADCWVRADVERERSRLMLDERVRAVLRRLEEETGARRPRRRPPAR